MFAVETSIFIDRPQQEVFDFVSNPANAHRWQGSTVSAEWTLQGPVGNGSTQRVVTRFMGRNIESTIEYTDWSPPDSYRFKVVNGPIPVEGSNRLEAEDDGTRFTMGGTVEAGGFFKIAEGLVKRQLEKQHRSDLETLKQLLEAG